jgi:CDP-diacylglycerol--serine O-phosphatidyltransferase
VLRENLFHAVAFICFLFLIGGVSRLARFNISHDAQPRNPGRPNRKYFVGMPIPAAAGLLASSVHLCYGYPNQAWWIALVWLALVGTSGFLMVSTWRFWSGKEINLSRRHPFQILFLIAIVLFIILKFSQVVLFSMALVYMFSGIWARAAYSWSRRRRRLPAAADDAALPTPAPDEPEPLNRS